MPSFLYPLFLAGAAAIAVPVVLHLLRRDVAPDVPFTAVRLLQRAPLEQTRRRRLRELLLLAARVAALLLLAGAFARPYFAGAQDAALTIVAIDRSYSMDAPGVFARALSLAGDAIDAAAGDAVAVIAFDESADVIAAPGTARDARGALQRLQPTARATRYAPVFARGAELSGGGPARLIVVTDLQRAGWRDEAVVPTPAHMQVEVRDAGRDGANAAVVAVRREGQGLVGTVRNDGRERLAGQARIVADSRTAAAVTFAAPPGATVDVSIRHPVPQQGVVAFEIDDPSGYAADNRRYLVLDATAPSRIVALVSDPDRDGFYIARALAAAGAEGELDVQVRPASSFGALAGPGLAQVSAVLLLSTRGLDRQARESLAPYVRAGGGLLIAAGADVEPQVLAAVMGWAGFSASGRDIGGAVLAATDLRHPMLRPFGAAAANLSQVRFSRAWHVRGGGWDVAASFTDGTPALLERKEGNGRIVLFASDLDRRWNDFPVHPGFVPFAMEAVRYIARQADARREYVVGRAPAGVGPAPGSYVVGEGSRRVAVNVDVRESAPGRMTGEEFLGMLRGDPRTSATHLQREAREAEARQGLWRYGLLLMLGVLVAESFVGREAR